jgi:hypothetical protein
MAELIIFCAFGVGLLLAHLAACIAYKLASKTDKSLLWLFGNF